MVFLYLYKSFNDLRNFIDITFFTVVLSLISNKILDKFYLEIPESIPEHNVKLLIVMFFFLDQ